MPDIYFDANHISPFEIKQHEALMNRKILALKTQLYSTGRFQVVLRASEGM